MVLNKCVLIDFLIHLYNVTTTCRRCGRVEHSQFQADGDKMERYHQSGGKKHLPTSPVVA